MKQHKKGGKRTAIPQSKKHYPAVSIAALRATSTVDLMTAAAALGLGRTRVYELAKRDEFPCKILRVDTYRVPTPGLLALLGAETE
jgi:hypothetical protein